jgi:hypothetical protein
MPPKKVDP